MKRQSFLSFFKQNYLLFEEILYLDKTLFSKIINEDYAPTEQELIDNQEGDQYADTIDKATNEHNKNDLQNSEKTKKSIDERLADPATLNDAEIELIKIYKNDPNGKAGLDARTKLIENKMKYIYACVHKQNRLGAVKPGTFQDCVQNAVIYLMRAIDLYDLNKASNIPFTAYAKNWIIAGIKNPYSDVRDKSVKATDSLDATISGSRGEWADKDTTLSDKIADNTAEPNNPLSAADDDIERQKLEKYLSELPERDAEIIRLRFFKEKNNTEIAEELGISKMAVSYALNRIISKLREKAKTDGFEPDNSISFGTVDRRRL